jgi:hypothetical protein
MIVADMSVEQVSHFIVTCDFPGHEGPDRALKKNEPFHHLNGYRIVCKGCWDNVMTFEELLQFINTPHSVMTTEDIPSDYLD